MSDIVISQAITIPGDALEWSFARSGGPGGQNVNKVNSKAILRWLPPADFLPPAPMARFLKLANRYLSTDGALVIQSQESRDQSANIELCKDKLKQLVRAALIVPKRRIATQPSKAAKRRRLEDKRRNADKKHGRGGAWQS